MPKDRNSSSEKLLILQAGRVKKCLDKMYKFDDGIRTLRQQIEAAQFIEKRETDGMLFFNKKKWNRMNGDQQQQYEARLRAKRYYWVNNIQVPKIVYDTLKSSV